MNAFTSWAMIICIAAVVCVLLELLLPEGSMEKNVRFVLGLFMLCAVILPLSDGGLKLDFNMPQFESYVLEDGEFLQQTDEQLKALGVSQVESLVTASLKKMNVEPKKIEINMDTGEDNSISIVLVTVLIDVKHKEEKIKIKQTLEEELGLDVEIRTEGSDANGRA